MAIQVITHFSLIILASMSWSIDLTPLELLMVTTPVLSYREDGLSTSELLNSGLGRVWVLDTVTWLLREPASTSWWPCLTRWWKEPGEILHFCSKYFCLRTVTYFSKFLLKFQIDICFLRWLYNGMVYTWWSLISLLNSLQIEPADFVESKLQNTFFPNSMLLNW